MNFKQMAIKVFEEHLSEWEADPKRMESGYNHEQTYSEAMRKVGQEVFQLSVGNVPAVKNSKKLQTSFGILEIRK